MKKILFQILRILITVLILFLIFRNIDTTQLFKILKNSNIFLLFLGVITIGIVCFIISLRWQLVLKLYNFNVSIWRAFRIYNIAFFFNNFLPSTIGMDFIRGAYIVSDEKRIADVISSIIIERWIGLLGIIVYISITPLIFFKYGVTKYFLYVSIIGILASVIFITVIISDKVFNFFIFLFSKIKILKIGEKINSLMNSLRIIKHRKSDLVYNLFLSIMIQVVFVVTNHLIVISQGLSVKLIDEIIYVPFISIISMIPITINGLGLREWAYINFFKLTTKEEIVSLSLTFFLVSVLYSIVGGFLFIFDKRNITKENK
ncbi:MAG: lysylphosphatidylglycerol synthase transmembrane domain-containing protein [bacterium]|nr:lysylphosphatidylglycerol synthase transmembrane domain-containing protein [bacterium]